MVMKNKGRGTSLGRIFLRFIFMTGISVVSVIILYSLLMGYGIYHGLLLPADHFMNIVDTFTNEIKDGKEPDLDSLPEDIHYAVYDENGKLLQTTFNKEQLKKTNELKDAEGEVASSYFLQKQYRTVKGRQKSYVFEYFITSEFASPFMRKHFAHVEWTLLSVGMIVILLDIVGVSMLYGKKMKKKVDRMKIAADQIREKNLDFDITMTGIKELDEVMVSLDELKGNLSESLNEQWLLQQQKKEQMGALAHDIKTPLTIIKGNVELLGETELSEEQMTYLTYTQNNIEKMQNYLKELIDISKGKNEDVQMEYVDGDTFFEKLITDAKNIMLQKNLHLVTQNEIKNTKLKLDFKLCQRAISNLIDNAVQYSKEEGCIYLRSYMKDDYVCFSVEDEGNGFSGEDLKYAAKEFYRANPNRNANEHFGMGLFIVKQIAELHGGEITLENTDKGAKVIFAIRY